MKCPKNKKCPKLKDYLAHIDFKHDRRQVCKKCDNGINLKNK